MANSVIRHVRAEVRAWYCRKVCVEDHPHTGNLRTFSNAIAALTNRGVNGYCWSSSRNSATNARNLNFNLNNANVNNNNVGNKFPLRLVPQEIATARCHHRNPETIQ